MKEIEDRANNLADPSNCTLNVLKFVLDKFDQKWLVEQIEKLSTATHLTKGGQEIDDNRAHEAAIKLVLEMRKLDLSYSVGLPLERKEIKYTDVNGTGVMEKLLQTTAGIAALERTIATAKLNLAKPAKASVQKDGPPETPGV
jgi:hypothetical protein